ncbi:MAG: DUF4404 family protein [Verrucomicrobiaceae bacterium]|nr:DUF4404 family protein [Verrucomicrobiaceae bacterium]
MDREYLQKLQTLVQNDDHLPADAKNALLELVTQAQESAPSPVEGEADTPSPLKSAVEELEAAHPEITAFLNRTAVALGNMGI